MTCVAEKYGTCETSMTNWNRTVGGLNTKASLRARKTTTMSTTTTRRVKVSTLFFTIEKLIRSFCEKKINILTKRQIILDIGNRTKDFSMIFHSNSILRPLWQKKVAIILKGKSSFVFISAGTDREKEQKKYVI